MIIRKIDSFGQGDFPLSNKDQNRDFTEVQPVEGVGLMEEKITDPVKFLSMNLTKSLTGDF